MKRREVLKRLAQFAAGTTVARYVYAAPTPDSARLETVRRMATETPSQAWASRSGRGSTLVYFGDGPAFEITFRNGVPQITSRHLTASEHLNLERYHQKIRGHLPTETGSVVGDDKFRVRGWVYNGRRLDQWVMSVEKI